MKNRDLQIHRLLIGIVSILVFAFVGTGLSPSSSLVRLSKHLPRGIANAQHLGRVPQANRMTISVAMKLRDHDGLAKMAARVHNPSDPLYGKFLTPQQIADQFGPTEQDIQDTSRFLSERGLSVTHVHPNRMVIQAEGAVADIESAFQLEMHQYTTAEGRAAFAPNQDPLMSETLAPKLHGIVGLESFTQARPNYHNSNSSAEAQSISGTGAGGLLAPSDIKNVYGLSGTTLNGSGETLALFELDGFHLSDINSYCTKFSLGARTPTTLPSPVVVDLGINGNGSTTPTKGANSGALEVTLDLELMIALAPAATILVYEGPNTLQGILDTYSKIQTDNKAQAVSSSWGIPEDQLAGGTVSVGGSVQNLQNAEESIFMAMAAQGISVYAATGDSGAYADAPYANPSPSPTLTPMVQDPSSDPWVVGVGGTTLTTGPSPSPTYVSESSWGTPGSVTTLSGGGGGISTMWSMPSWQSGLGTTANLGSTSMRMVPDVSLNANTSSGYSIYFSADATADGFTIYTTGAWTGFLKDSIGGTSCAAPLWAAFTGLVNQQRKINGLSGPLGFPNIALYQLAASANYSSLFHDIQDGSTNLVYPAVSGYDLSTGLGSFKGVNLINALSAATLPPYAPTGLTLLPHNASIISSWTASAGATSYTVSRSGSQNGPFTAIATGLTATNYTDTGLTNGVTYYYEVVASDAAGSSSASNIVSTAPVAKPPQVPGNFTATPLGGSP